MESYRWGVKNIDSLKKKVVPFYSEGDSESPPE